MIVPPGFPSHLAEQLTCSDRDKQNMSVRDPLTELGELKGRGWGGSRTVHD